MFNIANHAQSPGPAVYNNAYLMVMMVYGVVAVSITTALTPRMAAAWHARQPEEHARLVTMGVRMSLVVLVPATLLFALLGRQIGVTLFEFGDFTHTDSVQTGWIIVVGAATLIPFAFNQLQVIAFYAMGDTEDAGAREHPGRGHPDRRRPGALRRTAEGVGGGRPDDRQRPVVRPRHADLLPAAAPAAGHLSMSPVWATARRLVSAGVVRRSSAGAVLLVWVPKAGLAKLPSLVEAVVVGALIVGVYLVVAHRLRTPEVRDMTALVDSRLRRR